MVDFSAIASGFRQQRKDDRATRKDIADTFAQFRKDNPYATLEDMQDQINALSGGRNYLRAGLPSTSVLEGIATSNLEAKKDKELKNQFNIFNEKNEIRQKLREQAQAFLTNEMQNQEFLGGPKELQKNLLEKLEAQYMKTLSENLGTDLDMDMKDTIAGVFSIDNANSIRQDIFTKNVPEVKALSRGFLESKRDKGEEFKLTDQEVLKIQAQTKIPKWKIAEVFEQVKADFNKDMVIEGDEFLNRQSEIIKSQMQTYEEDWLSGTKTAQQIKDEVTNFITSEAAKRKLPIDNATINILVNANYSNLLATWEKKRREKDDFDRKTINDISNELLGRIFTPSGELNKTALLSFKNKGPAGLIALANEVLITKFDDDYFNRNFGVGSGKANRDKIMAEITAFITQQTQAIDDLQQDAFAQFRDKNLGNIAPQIEAEKKAIKDKTKTIFEGGSYINTTMKDGKLAGGNMVEAINRIAENFYLTNSHLDILAAAIKEYVPKEGGSVRELESYFKSVLGTNMTNWGERKKQLTDMATKNLPERQTFSEWKGTFNQSFDYGFDKIQSNISEMESAINSGQIDNLTLSKLNAITNMIDATKSEVFNAISSAGKNANIWVIDGQPDVWNRKEANALGQQLYDKLNTLKDKVLELKENDAVTGFNATQPSQIALDDEVTAISNKANQDDTSAAEVQKELKVLFYDRARQLVSTLNDMGFTDINVRTPYNVFPGGASYWYGRSPANFLDMNSRLDKSKTLKIKPTDAQIIQEQIFDPGFLFRVVQNKDDIRKFLDNPIEYIENDDVKNKPDIFADSNYLTK
jgi:hypothetical protein